MHELQEDVDRDDVGAHEEHDRRQRVSTRPRDLTIWIGRDLRGHGRHQRRDQEQRRRPVA